MSMTPPGYLICTHPRSGSTYLCQLLESTGKLGKPADYFNDRHMRRRYRDPANPAHLPEQYQFYLTQSATDNGVRSTKMFWFDFARVAQAGLAHHFAAYRIVVLERGDKLGQAISSSRALRSGKLWSHQSGSDDHVDYDYAHIRERLIGLLRADERWRQILGANHANALHLLYEAVVEDPQAAIDRIARYVGIDEPVPIDPARITVRVQRDARSSEWHRRFIDEAEKADPALLALVASARTG